MEIRDFRLKISQSLIPGLDLISNFLDAEVVQFLILHMQLIGSNRLLAAFGLQILVK